MTLNEGLGLRLVVIVGGNTKGIRAAEINQAGMLAGTGTIGRQTTGPTGTVAGRGAVGVTQRLVFLVRVGVGVEPPDLLDRFAHVSKCCRSHSRHSERDGC
jgi:hypothetical protein